MVRMSFDIWPISVYSRCRKCVGRDDLLRCSPSACYASGKVALFAVWVKVHSCSMYAEVRSEWS